MAEETLLTAARRIVRFVRIDDERHGGLLSQDTIEAIGTLDRQVKREERKQPPEPAPVDPPTPPVPAPAGAAA